MSPVEGLPVGSIRLTKVRKEVPLKLMYQFTGLVSAEVETGRDITRGEGGTISVHWRTTPLASQLLQFQWRE